MSHQSRKVMAMAQTEDAIREDDVCVLVSKDYKPL